MCVLCDAATAAMHDMREPGEARAGRLGMRAYSNGMIPHERGGVLRNREPVVYERWER